MLGPYVFLLSLCHMEHNDPKWKVPEYLWNDIWLSTPDTGKCSISYSKRPSIYKINQDVQVMKGRSLHIIFKYIFLKYKIYVNTYFVIFFQHLRPRLTIMYFGIVFPYLLLKTKVPVFYLSANKSKKLVLKKMFIFIWITV